MASLPRPVVLALTLSTLALLISPPALADEDISEELWTQRHRVELGLYLGALFPPRAHELYAEGPWQKPFQKAALDVGLRFGYLPWPFIGIELEGGVMPTWTRETDTHDGGESALVYTARAHVIGQYPHRFSPFILAGYGILGVSSDETNSVGKDVDGAFHAGLGLKFHATSRWTVRLDGRLIISGQTGPGGLMPHFEALAGASYALYMTHKEKPDRDGDGVPDDKDSCPDNGARTADGCPLPDKDGDGVPDAEDDCPEVAASTKDGCPTDKDGDGVPDDKDKCPDEAAKTDDGCLAADKDGDGVPDDKDKCPDRAAKTADGCPADGDGDGVPDPDDSCPDDPETKNGYKDDDGCPDEAPPTYSGRLPVVHFPFGKAMPRASDKAFYDRVVRILKKHPTLRLKLLGHADEVGDEGFNQKLSVWRAEEVQKLLIRRGIDASRLEIEGLGETLLLQPGQHRLNRRLEFKILR